MLEPDSQRQLHERHLSGDPTASTEIAEALFEPLLDKLQKEHRQVEKDLLTEAAIDALMGYLKAPEKFDPEKRSLFGYLVMAATGDLRNALDKIARRSKHEVSLDAFTDVELGHRSRNKVVRASDEAVARLDAESMVKRVDALFRDALDQRLVELVIARERKTEAYARILGLEDLRPEAQRREVKRHKDRIKKRLERHGQDTTRKQ